MVAVAERLGDVDSAYALAPREVGDGSGNAQHAVKAVRRKPHRGTDRGKHLPNRGRLATSALMFDRARWQRWLTNPFVNWTVFVIGVLLILASPIVGALPGPGGVFVFALGLAMVLRTSRWARRRYVHFKRWQPKAGRWTDWGLRRASARRRATLNKERKASIAQDRSSDADSRPGN